MDKRLQENLSALMDGEADELSVRRALMQAGDPEFRRQWARWHWLSDQLDAERRPWADMDLVASINAAIDSETAGTEDRTVLVQNPPAARAGRGSYHWPFAAMLILALGLGFGAGVNWDARQAGQPLAEVGSAPAATPAQVQQVPQVSLGGLDQHQRNQLSDYLLRHARYNGGISGSQGMVGLARVSSVSAQGR